MNYILFILTLYFGVAAAYYFLFAVASAFRSAPYIKPLIGLNRIAVFIPAYKEDGIIVDTARRALRQRYPANLFRVVIIADSLKNETLAQLKCLPVELIEVSFEKSTKARAINKAYEMLEETFDITVILDADNVMEDDFLKKINDAYNAGSSAMQAHRVAKNQQNSLATLDAISEEINNNIFRKGHINLGLSSALIGSGMAFDFYIFKYEMRKIDAIGGFDKELELNLLKQKIKISYLEDAYVYDEKVSESKTFGNQRTRWIAAQIRYGIKSFGNALLHLILKANVGYFDKSLQFLLPPRLILLGMVIIFSALAWLINIPGYEWMLGVTGLYFAALALAVPRRFINKQTLRASLELPRTFWLMLVAITGYKKAKTNFLHTPHQTVQS